MLNRQRHVVHELRDEGMFDESEAQRLQRAIEALVEGLTAWHWSTLQVPGTQHDVYCPEEISGEGAERVDLAPPAR